MKRRQLTPDDHREIADTLFYVYARGSMLLGEFSRRYGKTKPPTIYLHKAIRLLRSVRSTLEEVFRRDCRADFDYRYYPDTAVADGLGLDSLPCKISTVLDRLSRVLSADSPSIKKLNKVRELLFAATD